MRSYYRKQLLVRLLLFLAGVFLDILKKFSLPEGSAWERKSCLPVVTARRTVPLSV